MKSRMKSSCKRGHPLVEGNLHFKANGARHCRACNIGYQAAYRKANKAKIKKASEVYGQKNKERKKAWWMRSLYGMTQDAFSEMLKIQNGRCAICYTADPGKRGTFYIDHCHKKKKVRGLLCHNCNLALGHFKDSASNMRNAIKYIEG